MRTTRALWIAVALTTLASCRTTTPAGRENLHGVLWIQRAAEHRALCLSVFCVAAAMLETAARDSSWTAIPAQMDQPGYDELPRAIIVDVDETVLDNSPYQARLIRDGKTYTSESWNAWANEAVARALPGAVAFAQKAKQMGVTMFYVTNRDKSVEAATTRNLRRAGFPVRDDIDVVLTRGELAGEGAKKTLRRARVASTHRVILLLGDDLGDFLDNVKPEAKSKASAAELSRRRKRLVQQHSDAWGRRWFVLPNSMYGSWERVLRYQAGDGAKLQALQTTGG